MKRMLLFFILSVISFNVFSQTDVTEAELKEHIQFLTSDKNAGRYPGGKENRWVVKYIKNEFKRLGIKPFNKNYKQVFKAQLRVDKGIEKNQL